MDRLSSPGVRQLSVGEVRVKVRGDRGVLGVRGDGRVSQALYPLGGGVGIATPERWQQPSASDIQASKSFSLSQSESLHIQVRVNTDFFCRNNGSAASVCDGLMNGNFLYWANTHRALAAGPQQ